MTTAFLTIVQSSTCKNGSGRRQPAALNEHFGPEPRFLVGLIQQPVLAKQNCILPKLQMARMAVLNIKCLFVAVELGLANFMLVNNLPPQSLSNLASPTGPGPIVKLADMPVVSLALGILGALAMIALARVSMNVKALRFYVKWLGFPEYERDDPRAWVSYEDCKFSPSVKNYLRSLSLSVQGSKLIKHTIACVKSLRAHPLIGPDSFERQKKTPKQ